MLVPVLLAALWLRRSFNPFDVDKVLDEAIRVTSRSWEYGTLAEAMLELSNPELAVFSQGLFNEEGCLAASMFLTWQLYNMPSH